MIVPPGSTIGIIGTGQLGRMLAVAAAELGYSCHVYGPDEAPPAAAVSARHVCGAYEDAETLAAFAEDVDVVTWEFENIDPEALTRLAERVPVYPPARSLEVSRFRPAEKEFAREAGARTADYRVVESLAELERAVAEVGAPCILKTGALGYDGKGQARIESGADVSAAWEAIAATRRASDAPAIVERRIDFLAEFSVILCRGADGATVVWDVPENRHESGILDTSTVPASPAILAQAEAAIETSLRIAERLGHVGVLTCEYFATSDGPLFNEMAPRVHNSGHWTIEGARTSQFENHIRAICELPLGSTERMAARVEMRNLIGEDAEGWQDVLADAAAKLHLYGKGEARPGRKMGHVTRLSGVTRP
jgi:5-(carboxyamino)imidazole ribonucleotide synthase